MAPKIRHAETLWAFLRLGLIGFGGPPAHLTLFRREFVDRLGWLTAGELLDMIGSANLIPGPTSTEVAMLIGKRRGGWLGLILAGIGFILPAVLLSGLAAAVYQRAGRLPVLSDTLSTVRPAVIGVTFAAAWDLGRVAVKSRTLAVVGVITLLAAMFGIHSALALILPAIGFASYRSNRANATWVMPYLLIAVKFFGIGLTVFGGGYVLASYMEHDFAGQLARGQILDAVAVGQVTPGPVFAMATFVGYLILGPLGAVAATVGMFLPAFALAGALDTIAAKARQIRSFDRFLAAINVGAVALIASVGLQLGATIDWTGIDVGIGLASFAACLYKVNPGIIFAAVGIYGMGYR